MRKTYYDYILPGAFALAFIFTIPATIRGVVSEREFGMKVVLILIKSLILNN